MSSLTLFFLILVNISCMFSLFRFVNLGKGFTLPQIDIITLPHHGKKIIFHATVTNSSQLKYATYFGVKWRGKARCICFNIKK